MMFGLFLLVFIVLPIESVYQSKIKFTSMGLEYQPNQNIRLISTESIPTKIRCSAACNQLSACRIFDYDTVSKRCRLFESDSTTGSIISSSSSTSVVGTVQISSSLYSSTHNQPCQACPDDRYGVCSINTNTCQCSDHSYWNGTVCALQLLENQTCGYLDSCRSDLNLICSADCYGQFPKCVPGFSNSYISSFMPGYGITVAGLCNGMSSINQTTLSLPRDIILFNNETFYVADGSSRVFIFQQDNRVARTVTTWPDWVTHLFYDNKSSTIYGSVYNDHLVFIWPLNITIPPGAPGHGNCSLSRLFNPSGVVVDSFGNVYIASFSCHWITKWTPNATQGSLVAGLPTGTAGNDSQSLRNPSALVLDELNSFLYVADRYNDRIQRFVLNGSGIGVTVAGGNGQGYAPNQLNLPSDIYLSKLDGSLYIADSYNNRIQKWQINATFGVTVAGSLNGTSGNTAYLMDVAIALAVDDEENYVYVSDYQNNRIQRFSLH